MDIKEAQRSQPWTVPYASGVMEASEYFVPHILASHCALHVAKTAGKLAAVFEAMDHTAPPGIFRPTELQLDTIKAMSADLMTEALRFANLYHFDLEAELLKRRDEKNPGWDIVKPAPPPPDSNEGGG